MERDGIEKQAILEVARMMCLAARTAPKARGRDNLITAIISDESEIELIAKKMNEIAQRESRRVNVMTRDAEAIRKSPVLVLFAAKSLVYGLDCRFCGFDSCAELGKSSAHCTYMGTDLGIAIGSAVSIASAHHVDNRLMYSVGYAVRELNLLGEDATIIFGLPLAGTAKNVFFDRPVIPTK